VSGQLGLLQESVGEPRYIWKQQQIELTPAGEGLLIYAQRCADELELATDYVHRLQQH
jgi:DNA-binding transcriptional LysR family regulator